jgi:hypothetical protein
MPNPYIVRRISRRLSSAEIFTYVDGYGGDINTAQDTMLVNVAAGSQPFNYGQHDAFRFTSTQYTGLLKFNLTAIPAIATCISAKLYLYRRDNDFPNQTGTVSLWSILSGNANWIEGTRDAAQALAGEPNYLAKASDGGAGAITPWAGSVGCATPGTDFDATPIGSFSPPANDPAGTQYEIDLILSVVQTWFGAGNSNYGIRLLRSAGTSAGRVCSSEHVTTGWRPKLVVVYSV